MKNKYLILTLALFLPAILPAQDHVLQGRKVISQKCMVIQQPSVDIELWDAGVEDNDTVTLFLNGTIILEKHRLTKARETFHFMLKPGENELTLHANNLGDIPSNTAAFSVNGSEKISLHSGLNTSGSMRLHFAASPAEAALIKCDQAQPEQDEEASVLKKNPAMGLPSYILLNQGVRLYSNDPFRTVQIQDCYNSPSDAINLLLWDCGVEDGDTVSLMLNGQWILNNIKLTKAARSIPVKLQKGENIVLLYAHNLGDIPNNTAALAIEQPFSRGKTDVGMMISDENTCGAIRITLGFSDDYGNQISPCLNENKVDSTKEPEIIYQNSMRIRNPNNNNVSPAPQAPTYTPSGNYQTNPPLVLPVPITPSPAPAPAPAPPPVAKPSGGRQPGTPSTTPGRNTPPKPRH